MKRHEQQQRRRFMNAKAATSWRVMNRQFWLFLFIAASLLPLRLASPAPTTRGLSSRAAAKPARCCPKIKVGNAACCAVVAVPMQQLSDIERRDSADPPVPHRAP